MTWYLDGSDGGEGGESWSEVVLALPVTDISPKPMKLFRLPLE